MIFDLEIYQDGETGDGDLLAAHLEVDVQWLDGRDHIARAMKDGVEVARLETFDDYPITIELDRILIQGIINQLPRGPDDEYVYGQWILRRPQSAFALLDSIRKAKENSSTLKYDSAPINNLCDANDAVVDIGEHYLWPAPYPGLVAKLAELEAKIKFMHERIAALETQVKTGG